MKVILPYYVYKQPLFKMVEFRCVISKDFFMHFVLSFAKNMLKCLFDSFIIRGEKTDRPI